MLDMKHTQNLVMFRDQEKDRKKGREGKIRSTSEHGMAVNLESILPLTSWVTLDVLINFSSIKWDNSNDQKVLSLGEQGKDTVQMLALWALDMGPLSLPSPSPSS